MMTIGELAQRLHEYRKQFGDDTEVRLMLQPNYPFENALDGLVSLAELNEANEDAGSRPHEPGGRYGFNDGERPEQVIYLCQGRQTAYGDKLAWEAADNAERNADC